MIREKRNGGRELLPLHEDRDLHAGKLRAVYSYCLISVKWRVLPPSNMVPETLKISEPRKISGPSPRYQHVRTTVPRYHICRTVPTVP
jgi:hypothetical protein